LQAIERLHDVRSRSNIDAIRRHTKAILEEIETTTTTAQQHPHEYWNDTLFLQTLKSVVSRGEVDLCSNIQAELSPTYKRHRADSLLQKIEQETRTSIPPPQPVLLPDVQPHHVIIAYTDPKVPPHRPREHEKWKIIPKKVYDRTT